MICDKANSESLLLFFFLIQFCSFVDCFSFYILSSRVLPYSSLYIFGNFSVHVQKLVAFNLEAEDL